MAVNYNYHFAEVDDATHMCIGVMNTSNPNMEGPTGNGTTYVAIPEYNEGYLLKYYIDGVWYEDSAGTVVYIPE